MMFLLDQYNADYLHYLFLFSETFVKTKSSKDECSTDIQSFIFYKQIIWINGSLSLIEQKILMILRPPSLSILVNSMSLDVKQDQNP